MSTASNKESDKVAIIELGTSAEAKVVQGLGYPNGRDSQSPDPTGWQLNMSQVTFIEKQVSRETF